MNNLWNVYYTTLKFRIVRVLTNFVEIRNLNEHLKKYCASRFLLFLNIGDNNL